MKYTKTAAALALAGITAAPLAQAEPTVTLSGSVGINLASDDSDATDGEWNFNGDDSTLNIAATDTLSNGLTGYANYRLDSALSGSSTGGDSIHIGVKGDFGDIRIGEVDNAIEYGQVAGDILRDVGVGQDAGVSYTGTFGNFGVGLNWSPGGNHSTIGGGVKFNAAGFGIGIGVGAQGKEDHPAMSVGASYGIGGITAAVAFKSYEETVTVDAVTDEVTGVTTPESSSLAERESIGLKLSGSWNDIGLGLTYEADQGDGDADKIRLDASYGLGGGWGTSARVDVTDDKTDYRVQFSKSF